MQSSSLPGWRAGAFAPAALGVSARDARFRRARE